MPHFWLVPLNFTFGCIIGYFVGRRVERNEQMQAQWGAPQR